MKIFMYLLKKKNACENMAAMETSRYLTNETSYPVFASQSLGKKTDSFCHTSFMSHHLAGSIIALSPTIN